MAIPSIKNSVGMAVTSVASSGFGDITLGAALSGGYQTAATAYAANANIDIRIEEGDTWEVCRDCTYTHSGTTVTRGTLEDGSSGTSTRVAFTSAAKVYVVDSAERMRRNNLTLQAMIPGGRLTLESGVPVSTTDQTAKTSVYYTPYVHDVITLWDGVSWVPTVFTQKELVLGTVTAGLPYDVFGYLSAGELVLEKLAWTGATTRATGVSLQDGRYCKTGYKTSLLLGTFVASSTTTTSDSILSRLVSNVYNRVPRNIVYASGDAGHTWTGTSGFRQYNNSSAAKVQVVNCIAPLLVSITIGGINTTNSATDPAQTWIGINTTSSSGYEFSGAGTVGTLATTAASGSTASLTSLGLLNLNLLERNLWDAKIMTFAYGGISGVVIC